jgi:hypothetical protein
LYRMHGLLCGKVWRLTGCFRPESAPQFLGVRSYVTLFVHKAALTSPLKAGCNHYRQRISGSHPGVAVQAKEDNDRIDSR